MRFFLIFLLYFCFGFVEESFAQSGNEQDALLVEAHELVYNNPIQAIKIGEHLLKNTDSNEKRSKAALLIATGYITQGDYNKALSYVFRAGNFASETRNRTLEIQILICKSEILRELMLEDQSKKYLTIAQSQLEAINDEQVPVISAQLAQAKALLLIQDQSNIRQLTKSLALLQKARTTYLKNENAAHSDLLAACDFSIGKTYRRLENDSAIFYFEKALTHFQSKSTRNTLQQGMTLQEIGKYYFFKKDFTKAVNYFRDAMQSAAIVRNLPLQRDVNRQWSLNYLAMGDRQQYNLYNRKFLVLNDFSITQETEAINTAFNLISREQELETASQKKKYNNILYVSLVAFVILLLVAAILFFRNYSRKKRFSEIAKYLEISRNSIVLPTQKKEAAKNLIIPAETEKVLLAKLKKFEGSTRFTSKEMSLALLSAQLETNTKYLSEIINRHYQDNFNTYINKLRVNYIIEKLKTDPSYLNYKISYLADDAGFSSHSSFTTIFKAITGIAPGTFIDFLSDEVTTKKTPTS